MPAATLCGVAMNLLGSANSALGKTERETLASNSI